MMPCPVGTSENTWDHDMTTEIPARNRYKLCLAPEPSCMAGQCLEVRCLKADVNSDGTVDAIDRSVVVGVWTGSGYSPNTDVDLSGRTNATDRSVVVGAWTGDEDCSP